MGRRVAIPARPMRIVSLVPSQTELLAFLGLDAEVVGITKFCVHPAHWRKQKAIVGGTKQFRMQKIEGLRPDLIIGNKEENYEEGISYLAGRFPVWMSDIVQVTDAMQMIKQIGDITGKSLKASDLLDELHAQFAQWPLLESPRRMLYLIWRDPYMAAGKHTFISSLLEKAGFENAVADARYPMLEPSDIQTIAPEVILLSSEPYPFKDQHTAELQALCPRARIALVDGEMCSWYGSRLLQTTAYLREFVALL